ncbi:hypothetical protein CTAYLR_007694 [Chrysophaeum taylorii]|uniref:Calpain catalytic domain-containing protein n=1 Tax=Chrysophaeum taylorii TaxID=2483200 RepID=A0AAD7XHX3_9STRA|nr:hypothetical protein CTAYLR_007694 [Chrysophaeum taylorii]
MATQGGGEEEETLLCEEDEIIHRLRESSHGDGEMYYDVEFGGMTASVYWDESKIPTYDAALSNPIVWVRPQELCESPEYFVGEETTCSSLVEGRMGDAWLLGAMAAISGHPEFLVENLFGSEPDDFKTWGVYTCRFYREGEWQDVVTDTRIPCVADAGHHTPISGHCSDRRELWVALLAKAYAKALGNFEALASGSLTEALVDLTGGTAEETALSEFRGSSHQPLWDVLEQHLRANRDVVCCTVVDGEHDDIPSQRETPLGLLVEHAYCVVAIREVGENKFVLVRNPWYGRGDWRGPWSNGSTQWDDFPEILNKLLEDEELRWDRTTTGTFFMTLEDWCARFDVLHVCRLFPDEKYRQYKVRGRWTGKTAGGPLNTDDEPRAEEQEHRLTTALKSSKHVRCDDNNPRWFNNPQFRASTTQAIEVHMSLMQSCQRTATGRKAVAEIGFEIVRTKRSADNVRIFSVVQGVVTATAPSKAVREVSLAKVKLEPGWNYCVVVHTSTRGREGSFVFRTFSPLDLTVQVVPETHSHYARGIWKSAPEHNTAGGAPFNVDAKGNLKLAPRWCHNPQYFLKLIEPNDDTPISGGGTGGVPIDVKLVLRRNDDSEAGVKGEAAPLQRAPTSSLSSSSSSSQQQQQQQQQQGQEKIVRIGLVASCNAEAASECEKQGKEPRTNALGEPKPTKESTLKKKTTKSSRFLESQGILDTIGGSTWAASVNSALENTTSFPSRKVLLDKNEWHATSSFDDAAVATLFLAAVPRRRLSRGIVVVPSLTESEVEGSFVLEVHSDAPLSVEASPETKSRTVVGEWTDVNAGGSHLHPSWKINPKYTLAFSSGPSCKKVNILLARPEHSWKNADMVGAMMGFYLTRERSILQPENEPSTIFRRPGIFHEGRPWNESPFVPLHRVSTPPNFVLEAHGESGGVYSIMPATYAPGKKGIFYLSVTADAEFTLTPGANASMPR